jgi:non-heme chloroperoxidase
MASISVRESREIEVANASGNTPVVFIHGLWVLPSSWANWADFFKQAGYAPLPPDWPDDPATVAEARANPKALAKMTLKQVADHTTDVINALDRRPVVMGHSTGGLLAQMLAGRGLSAATVAIDPGVFRGVLPLPPAVLRSSGPFLINPLTRRRAITLTFKQFTYGWANALDEKEAHELYEAFHVAGSGIALAQDGQRKPQPVDTGEGGHEEPRPWPPAHHRGRERPHRALGDRERRLQAAEAQPRRDGDREDPEPGPRPHDRPRLARGCPDGPRLRHAVHLLSQPRCNTRGTRLAQSAPTTKRGRSSTSSPPDRTAPRSLSEPAVGPIPPEAAQLSTGVLSCCRRGETSPQLTAIKGISWTLSPSGWGER